MLMNKFKYLFILIFLGFSYVYAGTLLEAYQNALPGMGYDKLIILHPDSTYIGGLTILDEKVGIRGNGAIIDLAGGEYIYVTGHSTIEIDGCVIMDGSYGIHCEGNITAYISQCSFYRNTTAISFMTTMGSIEVYNTIISNSNHYGFASIEGAYRVLNYIDAYANADGNYMEFCPG